MERMGIKDWAKDAGTLVKLRVGSRLKSPKSYIGHEWGLLPVLSVEGLCEPGVMGPLNRLISDWKHDVYALYGSNGNKGIDELAEEIEEVIEKNHLLKAIGLGHSMGTIPLVKAMNDGCPIVQIIGIATPYNGSDIARRVPLKGFQQVTPESTILKEVMERCDKRRIFAISSELDPLVPDGILKGARNAVVRGKGHFTPLVSRETRGIVIREINRVEKARYEK